MMAGPRDGLRVLIVDQSASVRALLRAIVEGDPGLQVLAVAGDAYAAADVMREGLPDVILLGLDLPGMDGLSFLRRIMAQRPLPVVVCSAQGPGGCARGLAALEAGAVEVVQRPVPRDARARAEAEVVICDALRAASQSRGRGVRAGLLHPPGARRTADAMLPPPDPAKPVPPAEPVVVMGASTGGIEALRAILAALPPDAPAIAIVQHMPPAFTAAFARRIDGLCRLSVAEAGDGAELRPGAVLVAPGDRHLMLRRVGTGYRADVKDGPPVSRHRPSVDVLFRSAARAAGQNALGIILTGMGDDGARGMAEMRAAGGMTLAQDAASCIVYGMPGEAVAMGGVLQTVALDRMAAAIMAFARRHRAGRSGA